MSCHPDPLLPQSATVAMPPPVADLSPFRCIGCAPFGAFNDLQLLVDKPPLAIDTAQLVTLRSLSHCESVVVSLTTLIAGV